MNSVAVSKNGKYIFGCISISKYGLRLYLISFRGMERPLGDLMILPSRPPSSLKRWPQNSHVISHCLITGCVWCPVLVSFITITAMILFKNQDSPFFIIPWISIIMLGHQLLSLCSYVFSTLAGVVVASKFPISMIVVLHKMFSGIDCWNYLPTLTGSSLIGGNGENRIHQRAPILHPHNPLDQAMARLPSPTFSCTPPNPMAMVK